MDERKEQISFIIGMIDKLCTEFDIALIPCKTKKGLDYVGILDNTTGQQYAMVKKK